jgi:acetyltransferase
MSAARAAARVKPVVAVKAGRHAEGARAVASHTGALAGSDAVCQAAFDRAGILRVFSLAELFDAVETLALARPVQGDRLAILTNGGGVGVLATDALIEEGGRLATLSEATLAVLDRILPRTWSHGNPVDMIGDAGGRRYREAIAVLRQDPGLDAILALHAPTAVVPALEAAEAVAGAAADGPLLLTSWVGEGAMTEARRLFAERGIPSYGTPEQAVRAFMHLVRHRHARGLLAEATPSVPDGFAPDRAAVAALISATLGEGRRTLTEPEAKRVLAAYGVPAVATRTAATPEEAAAIAAEIGGPLVLKILSPDISHKSDLGGVVLDLVGPGAVLEAARDMLGRIRAARPRARIQGFAVEPMVRRPGAQELIVGIAEDPQFGPIVLVGQGGTAVEAIADRAIGLPPLNRRLARELIAHTRIHRVLLGGRGQPPADLDALALTLVQVAQLAIDVPEIRELDINPLLIDPTGVIALDARIALAEVGGSGSRPGGQKGVVRLAIRPYPRELETEIQAGDGRRLLLRPIRPEDEPALRRTFALLGPRSSTHLFGTKGDLDQATAARLTQIDYEREMILVVTEPGSAAPGAIHGLVRLVADPDRERAEVDLATSEAIAGLGIEPLTLRLILDHARHRGIREVCADLSAQDGPRLRLYEGLGFQQGPSPDAAGNIRVSLHLKAGTASES